MKKFGYVVKFGAGEGSELRHSPAGSAIVNHRADQFALLVMQNKSRAKQVGSGIAAGRFGAMAKSAG